LARPPTFAPQPYRGAAYDASRQSVEPGPFADGFANAFANAAKLGAQTASYHMFGKLVLFIHTSGEWAQERS
jgi:hypothetical protein